MPLFEVPKRLSKEQDKKIAGKSLINRTSVPTVKGNGGILGRINEIKAVVEKNLGQYRDEYIVIREQEVLHDYLKECSKNSYISIDTETDGLDPLTNHIAGICIYTPEQKGAYIPLNHLSYVTMTKVANQLDVEFVAKEFKELMNSRPNVDMFNANFDVRFMKHQAKVDNIYCTWDGYLAARLLNENEPTTSLKPLHNKYCLDGKGDAFRFDELFNGIPFTYIPINTGYLYAAHDPVITYELCEYQRRYLRPDSDREDMRQLYWVFENIEMPCVDAIVSMEDNGIAFDKEYANDLSDKYHKLLSEKQDKVYECINLYKDEIEAYKKGYTKETKTKKYYIDSENFEYEDYKHWQKTGKHIPDKVTTTSVSNASKLDDPINISSPTQLAILFYDILGFKSVDKKSPRGTGVDVLTKIDNPICKALLEYREVNKLLTTYIDKLPECVYEDGRIHCKFNQYGADTGRMSSNDPNLQNIPSHNKDIRKMFVASDGYVLMSSDFSQQEPKCLAALCKKSGDEQMYNTFMQGKDLYSEIASKAFNKDYDECREFRPDGTTNKEGKERRTQAKSILLGVLYGRGEKSIAEQLKCSEKKAKEIKESVFRGFPAIKQFEEDSLYMAKQLGYVTTVCGRKRRLPDLQLPEFEFRWINGIKPDDDLLDWDAMNSPEYNTTEVPEDIQDYYLDKLEGAWYSQKLKIYDEAKQEGIAITDNGGKIADATRQCVNSRIQGSAADLTKLAMIKLNNNQRLKELGFRLLIPVHDEVIAECPEENVKECSKLLAEVMSKAAEEILKMPIKCDVEITKQWYGEVISI